MAEQTDVELLKAWRAGNRSAGSILLRRHFAAVHRFFRTKVPEDADDLTQRTFLACVESRDTIDPDQRFVAYLFGIARNRVLTFVRDRKCTSPVDTDSVCAADLVASPELGHLKRQERRLVLAAMRRIPLDYQVALELFYWESFSVEEIASVLQAPLGTIKSRLSRGRGLLRDEIAASVEAPDLRDSTLRYLAEWIQSLRAAVPVALAQSPADA